MKKAIIFSGGDPCKVPDTKGCFVVCADSGYDSAVSCGIVPDMIIGDMDSAEVLPENIPMIKANTDKDETDTQLCIDYLIENGYDDITVVCALGGRIDHEFANIMLTAYGIKRGAFVRILADKTAIFAIDGEAEIRGKAGDVFSMFPIGGDCEKIFTQGLKYPLSGGTLFCDVPMGISNVMTEDTARISVGKGILVVVHYSDIY